MFKMFLSEIIFFFENCWVKILSFGVGDYVDVINEDREYVRENIF